MNFLNNKEDHLDNSSSDYSDEEFEYIDYDNIDFENPIKNKQDIYIANLDEKIILELDNLEVFEVIEEGNKTYVIFNLDLDNDDHNELLEILYNLDEKALEKCFDYSKEWFNKEMGEEDIENLYIPLYIDNYKQKGHVLMKVLLDTNINMDKLHITNVNIIEIKGLTFYKNRFLYHIILKDILEENINLIDNIDNTDTIDTIDTKDTKDTNDTNDTTNKINDTDVTEDTENTKNTKVSNTKKNKKYKELLERKRLEVKQKFIESEKKNKEAEQTRLQAIESANELRKIEKELNNE